MAIDALQAKKYKWVNFSKAIKIQKYLTTMLLMKRYPQLKAIHQAKAGDIHSDPLMWQVLILAREKDATELRDKVYGLYGILKELDIPVSQPDYNLPVETIFRDLTIACINSDKYLYVLYDVPSDRRYLRPNLVSWVPDWSDNGWRTSLNTDSRVALTRDRFCAAGSSEPVWCVWSDGNQLCLSGKIVDTIIYCGDPLCTLTDRNLRRDFEALAEGRAEVVEGMAGVSRYRRGELSDEALVKSSNRSLELQNELGGYLQSISGGCNTLRSWVDTAGWYREYPTGETPAEALCRTLIQDDPKHIEARNAFAAWYRYMTVEQEVTLARPFRNLLNLTRQGSPSSITSENTALTALHPPHGPYHAAALTYANRKTFSVTENGYVGTAAAIVKEDGTAESLVVAGDKVGVIAGLEMPMVLTPANPNHENGCFKLRTHAHAHGIMYGEAWENREHRLQDIILV